MGKKSKTLEETALWKSYRKRMASEGERVAWTEKVCESAMTDLNNVRLTFPNYTLHDGTHVLNVLDAMGGLLGDFLDCLTDGETELLILSAALHDLGMVYTESQKAAALENLRMCRAFLAENHPELAGCAPQEWPEEVRQGYLRWRHPFRIQEVLQTDAWRKLFDAYPMEAVSRQYLLAVCQAHGEKPGELRDNPRLRYLEASDADPLFCALLLRLADLLDFDHTRAPEILYGYAEDNERSRLEWDRHRASAGFRYPQPPSGRELPYLARCKNPGVEHAVRTFLDWVDDELANCAALQRYCREELQKIPFPRAVNRREIESVGYASGDFCLTMDQDRILELLMGENLYDNRDVFVRELLQNAVDATLLRGEMEDDFKPEEAGIEFWEWTDGEGKLWFRIDDRGTGMTLGMLQRYFLKVGNSYYTSRELKRDLRDRGQTGDFQGISRFGIGFLSCFLCSDYAEVSTLYFDRRKNRREEETPGDSQAAEYGLRLQVTGLKGYYILKNQAECHPEETPFPRPPFFGGGTAKEPERDGYRKEPGTSVALRLDPGRLGTLNLRDTVLKYLCGARMPVYYNGRRIGSTYDEAMKIVHGLAGERFYELSPEKKEEFDRKFPALRGNYPRLAVTAIPLDTEEDRVLPGLSGALVKYAVRFDREPRWSGKGSEYEVKARVYYSKEGNRLSLKSYKREKGKFPAVPWKKLEATYGVARTGKLRKEMDAFDSCPRTEEDLGEAWAPFSGKEKLEEVWRGYLNQSFCKGMSLFLGDCGFAGVGSIFKYGRSGNIICAYQGVIAGAGMGDDTCDLLLLTEGEYKPAVKVSRSEIVHMPLRLRAAVGGILEKYGISRFGYGLFGLRNGDKITVQGWREVRNSPTGQWIINNLQMKLEGIINRLQKPVENPKENQHKEFRSLSDASEDILNGYYITYLQDDYYTTINYEQGQIIAFREKEREEPEAGYDIFPPMMFCQAASDLSRRYLCHERAYWRRAITADHPFAVWLLKNSALLNRHFQRQFQQIVESLCEKNAEDIVSMYEVVREQLRSLGGHYGLDVTALPQLSLEDFWKAKDEQCPF